MPGPRNAFERKIDDQLRKLKAGAIYEGARIPYNIEGLWYHPDWVLPNGNIIEAKGFLDKETKRKMVAVKKCNPNLKIFFVFYDAHKKISGTKETHADWAIRNGFGWSHEVVLEEWTK